MLIRHLYTTVQILLCALIIYSDIRWKIIPYIYSLVGIALLPLFRAIVYGTSIAVIAVEIILCYISFSVLRILTGRGFGKGDVHLAAFSAAGFGAYTALISFVPALFSAAIYALLMLATGKKQQNARIPWAPFYLTACLLGSIIYFPVDLIDLDALNAIPIAFSSMSSFRSFF
ncbi:hypothetical protein JCM12856_20050 [Spirochaeta dissipatitropha]